ncbi:MAG: M16 family metallopeptidase [Eubacteriales bacterium]|jgi:predicted Zn-dependent peptidase
MIHRYTLDNGLRVVVEPLEHLRSATMGIWVAAGSRCENKENNGVSHFLEHMFFKGTARRSAADIAREMDRIGGQSNAFTAKECTCFHAKCLDEHLEEAFAILADMYHNSLFRPQDIETERGVIREEINMYEDSPDDLCIDLLHENMWRDSTLALPILGTADSVAGMDREMLLQYRSAHYTPGNTVIAVAGKVEPEQFLHWAQREFGAFANLTRRHAQTPPVYRPCVLRREKEIEQNHLAIGLEGAPLGSDELYPQSLVNNILGGSMSSRLFQEIREKRGLAYSIYSFTTSFQDTGALTIYAGLNPSAQRETLEIIRQEMQEMAQNGVSEEEFRRGREQIKANLIMGQEGTSSRMSALARGELFHKRYVPLEEMISKLEAVTLEQVNEMAARVLRPEQASYCVVGQTQDLLPGE